jgi:type VI secretion system protein ImpG
MEDYPVVQKILCLRRPTAGSPAPLAKASLWRLISQLSLNHLSLVEEGKNALQSLLRIHNFADLNFGEENIEGISELVSHPHFARVSSEHGMAFVRGKRVQITMDETRFAGSGIFLFASILERFLGLYTSLNSFSQLTLRSQLRGDKPVHTWPPRSGVKVVV